MQRPQNAACFPWPSVLQWGDQEEETATMKERTNQEWLTDLRGPNREEALADLRDFLVRGLGYALANRRDVTEAHVEDFVQDALLKILDALDTFRGDSKFTTWAQKIAVNTAFSELRRLRWQDISLDGFVESYSLDFVPDMLIDPEAGPEQQVIQRIFLETLRHAIANDLTDKQRQALVAVKIQGVPLAEVARRMDSNRNAMYKLIHDARQRLRERMEERGVSAQEILEAFR